MNDKPLWQDPAFLSVIVHSISLTVLQLAHVQLNESFLVSATATVLGFVTSHHIHSARTAIAAIKQDVVEKPQ